MNRIFLIVAIVCMTSMGVSSQAAETPLQINVRVFSMTHEAMDELKKDGLTRAELDSLESRAFKAGGLFEGEGPLEIAPGRTEIEIPRDKLLSLREQAADRIVVFMFELVRTGDEDAAVEIVRRSYSLSEKDGESVKIRDKKSQSLFPEKTPKHRIMDYRFGSIAQYQEFYYELHLTLGGDDFEYTLYLNMQTD
ncbi:MAG: hypothetical protein P9L94_17395 [Candidatus Hinthialibacter antarcticus]|nr:hypothetical protein [Candidatus Hinthialibacter antarcticus]